MVCVEGRLIGIEVKFVRAGESVKHARGRATPLQRKEIEDLTRAGAVAGVATSVEEALALVEESI